MQNNNNNKGNRPVGRKKFVVGGGNGVEKRGEGLGTGKVGNQDYTTNQWTGQKPTSQGSNFSQNTNQSGGDSGSPFKSGGSKGGILIIAVIVIAFFLFGGGNIFGNLCAGGGGQTIISSAPVDPGKDDNNGNSGNTQPTYAAASVPDSLLSSLQGYSSASWSINQNTSNLDNTVSAGAREKRTQIYGNGKDNVLIMVYMCGTDLESQGGMATRDLLEMTKATVGNNVHLLVYTGGCSDWQNNVVDTKANYVFEVTGGGLKKIATDDKKTMTNPDTLSSFIKFAVNKYPCNRRELIFWDHGGGAVQGYGYDETRKTAGTMTLDSIKKALTDAGSTYDFIGFDTCLMGTVENALMLDDFADYLIASEETEPGIGWYYTNWITQFSKNTGIATTQLGKIIIDDFVDTCSSQCRGQPATLSLVDLAELKATVPEPLEAFYLSVASKIKANDYKDISKIRGQTREFGKSSKVDQIDLVDFANRVGNTEGSKLASALKKAVKYNRTSSDMSDAYGIAAYFPYRKVSQVNSALNTFKKIGLSDGVSDAIKSFASVAGSGQAVSGGNTSALSSIFGMGGSSNTSSGIEDILGNILGGGSSSSSDPFSFLTEGLFGGRGMTVDETVGYLRNNYFDSSQLEWKQNTNGDYVLQLSKENWDLVTDMAINMFYDDGEGYIDLGIDNAFEFDASGNPILPTDKTWLSVNGQIVAYYYDSTTYNGNEYVILGYIPALLNGNRVELITVFTNEIEEGTIVGARQVYTNGETANVAKSIDAIQVGDKIDFVCDYYDYNGNYKDSYKIGKQITYNGKFTIANMSVGTGQVRVTYRFTDIYGQNYWSQAAKF